MKIPALPPKDALRFWRDKMPVSRAAFMELAEDERVRAFFVSGMARGDMLTAMYESIGNALKDGQSYGDWRKKVTTLFQAKGWTGPAPHRLDNIFRTNIQTAYQVGRYKQMMSVVEDRPYWQYSAVCDRRTRPQHMALHGRVVRADDPFWDTYYPPNGFRCRCTVKTLSEGQVRRRGLTVESPKTGDMLEVKGGPMRGWEVPLQPDKYFGTNQGKAYWKADFSRYRADVKQAVLADIARVCGEGFEFSRVADFADSPCFRRLKRHLTQTDLEDLQTVVWAKNKQLQQGFGQWLDTIDPHKPRGELYPVGNLPGKVLRYLDKQGITPRLSLITLTDAEIGHMVREAKAKRRAVLSLAEIRQLPKQILRGRWWFDHQATNCLMSWVRVAGDGVWLKMAMELDYKIFNQKGLVANSIRTTGVIKPEDIAGDRRYEEIF